MIYALQIPLWHIRIAIWVGVGFTCILYSRSLKNVYYLCANIYWKLMSPHRCVWVAWCMVACITTHWPSLHNESESEFRFILIGTYQNKTAPPHLHQSSTNVCEIINESRLTEAKPNASGEVGEIKWRHRVRPNRAFFHVTLLVVRLCHTPTSHTHT